MPKAKEFRTCFTCKLEKPNTDFPHRSRKCSVCITGEAPYEKVTHRICATCRLDKPAEAFNKSAVKCMKCVADGVKNVGETKTGPKGRGIIKCARCGEMKKHNAKGLCAACWQVDRLEKLRADPSYYQMVKHKICQKCKIDKPSSSFPKNILRRDMLQAWCSDCLNEQYVIRKSNPEWAEENRRKSREAFNNLSDEDKRAKHDRNYETQKERLKNSPEYRKRKNFQMTRKNLRRDNLIEAGAQHTLEEWEALCKKYDYKCLRCGKVKPLTEDHVIPLSLGGADTIDNIQPLCLSCNSRKNNRYIEYRPEYKERPQ